MAGHIPRYWAIWPRVSLSSPLQDGMVSGNVELVQNMVMRGGQQPMGAWTAMGPGVQSDLSYSRRGECGIW